MVYIKSLNEILEIKKACNIFKKIREICLQKNLEGKSLKEIDEFTKQLVEKYGGSCAFHGYQGFPGYNCMSMNEVIIHGIGTHDVVFGPKDKLTLDIGINYNGYICDSAFNIFGSKISDDYLKLSSITLNAIYEACKVIKPGNTIGDISFTIEKYVKEHDYQILKNYGGHGCGLKIHEDPIILNYGKPNTGFKLKSNMVICIEPMLLEKSDLVHIDKNN